MSLTTDIAKYKKQLIKKQLHENFGQKEVIKLKTKYCYDDLKYGTPDERMQAKAINSFDQWCMNYTGE